MNCRCPFGSDLRICHCPKCHETFTTITAFDLHQSHVRDGTVICHDPASRRRRDGSPVFVRVGDAWAKHSKATYQGPA